VSNIAKRTRIINMTMPVWSFLGDTELGATKNLLIKMPHTTNTHLTTL
jgi:hypothetical protein